MRVVASNELLNKVKYRNKDSVRMFVVHFFSACRAPFFACPKIREFTRDKTFQECVLFLCGARGILAA
jgi:hypothetical protein